RAHPSAHGGPARPDAGRSRHRAHAPIGPARLEIVPAPPMTQHDAAREDWLVTRLLDTLRSARHKALLISPYFVPGVEGTEGLVGLAAAGAQVGVVTNSLAANDVPAVHSGYARYRGPLLRGGVQLHEMRARGAGGIAGVLGSSGASLHTKAFVVDDARGFV